MLIWQHSTVDVEILALEVLQKNPDFGATLDADPLMSTLDQHDRKPINPSRFTQGPRPSGPLKVYCEMDSRYSHRSLLTLDPPQVLVSFQFAPLSFLLSETLLISLPISSLTPCSPSVFSFLLSF